MRPDVPIIMITAYGDAQTKRQALEIGAEACRIRWKRLGQDVEQEAANRVAVGTLITERPPHRSVRAQFRHTAPTLSA